MKHCNTSFFKTIDFSASVAFFRNALFMVFILLPLNAYALNFTAGPGINVIGICNGAGSASELDMIMGFNAVNLQIEMMGGLLSAGQIAQSSTDMQIMQQVRNSIRNAAKQQVNGLLAGRSILNNPLQSNGTPYQNACNMAQAAGGALQGGVAAATLGQAVQNAIALYNTGRHGAVQYYVAQNAAATPIVVTPQCVIGQTNGSGSLTTCTAQDIKAHIALTTNPVPLPILSASAQKTPAGLRYMAIRHIQEAKLSMPQEAMNSVAMMNTPLYPLQAWATKAMDNATKNNPTLNKAMTNILTTNSKNGELSQNTFLYVLDQSHFGNPDWWSKISTSPTQGYILRQGVITDAAEMDISLQSVLLLQKIDGMEAIQSAQNSGDTLQMAGMAARNTALSGAMN